MLIEYLYRKSIGARGGGGGGGRSSQEPSFILHLQILLRGSNQPRSRSVNGEK